MKAINLTGPAIIILALIAMILGEESPLYTPLIWIAAGIAIIFIIIMIKNLVRKKK